MFNEAIAFHNSLIINGQHVIERDDVTVYKLVGTGVETISAVNLSSDYTQASTTSSSNGDGTVLVGSATYGDNKEGETVFTFHNVDHMNLVESDVVLSRIIEIITSETQVPAAEVTSQANIDQNSSIGMEE